jgi:GDP-mannose 6-dehydrogenase
VKISVFGLGYVGCVSAACLAQDGHEVIGVDVNPLKVNLINSALSPVVEPGLDEIVATAVASGALKATQDGCSAILESDISLICVGTPSKDNGSLNLEYVEAVCRQIGQTLAEKADYHVVVIRSTVLPGTVEERLIPILEQYSSRLAGSGFGVSMNPEFLREGSGVKDYINPSLIVIGELDHRSGDMVARLYANMDTPVTRTQLRNAEMIKYVSNTFHALKIVFANEIGNLSKANGVDGQEIMDIICQDRQLNISTAYLKPGFAFGGSCLPKDMRALLYRAKELDVDCALLSQVLPSNRNQIDLGIRMVEKTGQKRVGILGLSFKADTDDLRESPAIILAETLLGRGYQVRIFDEKLQLDKLVGANKLFLENELPHIASLLRTSLEELASESDVVVVTNGSRGYQRITGLLNEKQTLIDLVGFAKQADNLHSAYEGICW